MHAVAVLRKRARISLDESAQLFEFKRPVALLRHNQDRQFFQAQHDLGRHPERFASGHADPLRTFSEACRQERVNLQML